MFNFGQPLEPLKVLCAQSPIFFVRPQNENILNLLIPLKDRRTKVIEMYPSLSSQLTKKKMSINLTQY